MYGLHGYLVTSHSGLRWLLLLMAIGSIGYAINGLVTKREIDDIDDRLSKFTVVFAHIQLVLGLMLYFVTNRHLDINMSDAVSRFWSVEHLVGMLIGIALITVGRAKYKRGKSDHDKMKATVVYFSLGLLMILATIPWPFREYLGKAWF
ncbi:MAG: hypothetical protein K9J06_02605 [Flavobacteriales bacterium]|nr:hypothetical protein [Flavobacteriales bacterium]